MSCRIQRKRTKGWKMPPNTVSVCRPGKWGNPHKVGYCTCGKKHDQAQAVEAYRAYLKNNKGVMRLAERELCGKNLACFCLLNDPCHADVLLEVANAQGQPERSDRLH